MDERGIGMDTEPKWSIGVISGTSMDGIDVALLRTDGRDLIEHGPGATLPYPARLREALAASGADTLELTTHDDLLQALLRWCDLRRQRARLKTSHRFPAAFQRAAAASQTGP